MKPDFARLSGGLILVSLLAACTGDYGGAADRTGNSQSPAAGTGTFSTPKEFFAAKVEPGMSFCRSCHVPGGVADTDKGRRFMLSGNAAEDFDRLNAAWIALGKGVETNRILTKASDTDAEPHSGGAPWPQGSVRYNAMKTLLSCWDNPTACAALLAGFGGGDVVEQFPLLGTSHGGHPWFDYCEGKADDAELPVDPRTLVTPRVSDGKAVHFNFPYRDCSAADGRTHARTCGELRARRDRGALLLGGNGKVGAGTLLAGDYTDGQGQISAAAYNNIWQKWGLSSRPAKFDELAAERYGLTIDHSQRNPYPLPGEDPNKTNGGSGQLSTALTQIRNPDGSWTGKMGYNCQICHGMKVGDPDEGEGLGFQIGGGNTLADIQLIASEVIGSGDPSGFALTLSVAPYSTATTWRGMTNAFTGLLVALVTRDLHPEDPNLLLAALLSPSTGDVKAPAWWNNGKRTSHFSSSVFPGDALRTDLAFYTPTFRGPIPWQDLEGSMQWVKDRLEDSEAYMWSTRAPKYPGPIDTALAEQGAVLFHSKNLWAPGLNNTIPKPEGNGSCAGCHGAYSPRYANDPAYLADPRLMGITAYTVPLEIIGTDPANAVGFTGPVAKYASKNDFFAYSETLGAGEKDCTIDGPTSLAGQNKIGYIAHTMHGIWARAPYLHNASVPSLWDLLKPSDRPALWRRVSTPGSLYPGYEDQVMGYDTNFARAYDTRKMGWKYDVLACGQSGLQPYIDCSTGEAPALTQELLNLIFGNSALLFNIAPPAVVPMTRDQIEKRKIYNTNNYSHSNKGHEWTAVLTDQERMAIIEYLKTL